MEQLDRFKLYEDNLKKLLEAKNKDSFVIFTDSKTNKFIQFCPIEKERKEVMCDIPFQQLNAKHRKQIVNFGFKKEDCSYILLKQVDEIITLIDKIFLTVFNSGKEFILSVESNVEESRCGCDGCGKITDKLQCTEVYLENIDKLPISKENLNKLIQLSIASHEEEAKDLLSEKGLKLLQQGKFKELNIPLFFNLCSSCKKISGEKMGKIRS